MATVNGSAAKPAVASSSRPAVVPVLPLNYPQRPVNKKVLTPATNSSAPKGQNGSRQAEKPNSYSPKDGQGLNGHSTGPSSRYPTNYPSISKESGAYTRDTARADPAPNAAASDEGRGAPPESRSQSSVVDTPAVSSTLQDRRSMASPVRDRAPRAADPASELVNRSGPALGGAVPAPHPATMNRPASFHQPHPSNGSLIFGGLHDSNSSSPAPRLGGGGFPAPPGLLPYPHAAVDGYGRPLLVSPAVDGYPPSVVNHHGPPTPHSFHESQSSAQAEEHGANHYPAANGYAGYAVDPSGQGALLPQGLSSTMNGTAHLALTAVSAYQGFRDQEEALSFLRHGISDHSFSDCVLEVRFSDSTEFQDHPSYRQLHHLFRTQGHRFILSRSPTLAGVMKAQGTMPGGVIFLEAHDEYMRSDVFWYSFRTLYGWSLADGILPTELPLRDVRDDLKTALSYIATGRFLQLPWVHSVAVHRASRLLLWNTIELAAAFVSKTVALCPRDDGFGVSELVDQVVAFIVHNFPVDFVLDTGAGDYGFSRLPPLSTAAARNRNAPTIANGTSGGLHSRQSSNSPAHMPRNPRVSSNLRLSQIKFGDISPSKNGSPPTANDTVLSRILLNLPFELLKKVLEHPHLANGELSAPLRQSIINDIVAEREARRSRALEKADPQLRPYQERVESAAAPLVVSSVDDFWTNNMGFKEEVFPGDVPYLVHTWSPATPSSAST